MKTQNRARISVHAVVIAVVFAFLLLLAAPSISADMLAPGDSDHSGMSSGDAVSTSVSLDILSPLNASYKAAEPGSLSQTARGFRHLLTILQLALLPVMSFAVLKTRGLSCHSPKAVFRTHPISIFIGGHAPPLFRA